MQTISANKADIAFWTGFYNDEDCCSWASNKAYLDMNRTMTFRDVPNNNTQSEKNRVDKARKGWRDLGTNAIRESLSKSTDSFETWHKKLCAQLIDIYGNDKLVLREGRNRTNNPAELTYGQAQKWLNMTLKYLWLLNRLGWIDDPKIRDFIQTHETSFHVPLDSYILRYVAKQNKSKKDPFSNHNDNELNGDFQKYWDLFHSEWSQITDVDAYYRYQSDLSQSIASLNMSSLEWELIHWHKALKYYDSPAAME